MYTHLNVVWNKKNEKELLTKTDKEVDDLMLFLLLATGLEREIDQSNKHDDDNEADVNIKFDTGLRSKKRNND